jgi:hypothetical protein
MRVAITTIWVPSHGLDMAQVELSPQEDEELASLGLGSGRSKLCQIVSGAISV